MKLPRLLALLYGFLYVPGLVASDIARDLRSPGDGRLAENGGYFEIGLGARIMNRITDKYYSVEDGDTITRISLAISGEYRYNGLFFEAAEGSFDGINAGYTLWNDDTWQLDLLGSRISGGLYGVGFRATGYFENTILQYRLLTDPSGRSGIETSLRLGKHWQYRNWNFHSVAGVNYRSAETTQYTWGIDEESATERYPVYTPGDSFVFEADVGATYPVSENWVFRAGVKHFELSDEIANSPELQDDRLSKLYTTFTYVF